MEQPLLVTVVGPTAIGKTEFAIRLAEKLNTEIISADSRQFYKSMSIGTAKPTEEERSRAEHHFVDFIEMTETVSAGEFERRVLVKLDELFCKKNTVIMAGGSGLFVNAVLKGFDPLPHDPEIREKLMNRIEQAGFDVLVDEIRRRDPLYCQKADLNNTQRVVRALEVCLITGKTYTELRSESQKNRPFKSLVLGLNGPREWLYDRINRRVDLMFQDGLIEEVAGLINFRGENSMNTVGYKELVPVVLGQKDIAKAKEEIKQNTRRFAKRQLTWFRNQLSPLWLDATDQETAMQTALKVIQETKLDSES